MQRPGPSAGAAGAVTSVDGQTSTPRARQDDRHREARGRARVHRLARAGRQRAGRSQAAREDPEARARARLLGQHGGPQSSPAAHADHQRRHPARPRSRPVAHGSVLHRDARPPGRRGHAARLRHVPAEDPAADGRLAADPHRLQALGRHHRHRPEHRARRAAGRGRTLPPAGRLGRAPRPSGVLLRGHGQSRRRTRGRRAPAAHRAAAHPVPRQSRPSPRSSCATRAIAMPWRTALPARPPKSSCPRISPRMRPTKPCARTSAPASSSMPCSAPPTSSR